MADKRFLIQVLSVPNQCCHNKFPDYESSIVKRWEHRERMYRKLTSARGKSNQELPRILSLHRFVCSSELVFATTGKISA